MHLLMLFRLELDYGCLEWFENIFLLDNLQNQILSIISIVHSIAYVRLNDAQTRHVFLNVTRVLSLFRAQLRTVKVRNCARARLFLSRVFFFLNFLNNPYTIFQNTFSQTTIFINQQKFLLSTQHIR